jgi:hypothetical protein
MPIFNAILVLKKLSLKIFSQVIRRLSLTLANGSLPLFLKKLSVQLIEAKTLSLFFQKASNWLLLMDLIISISLHKRKGRS